MDVVEVTMGVSRKEENKTGKIRTDKKKKKRREGERKTERGIKQERDSKRKVDPLDQSNKQRVQKKKKTYFTSFLFYLCVKVFHKSTCLPCRAQLPQTKPHKPQLDTKIELAVLRRNAHNG